MLLSIFLICSKSEVYSSGSHSTNIASGEFIVIDIEPKTFLIFHNPKDFTGQVKASQDTILGSNDTIGLNFTTYNGSFTVTNPNNVAKTCYFTIFQYGDLYSDCKNVITYVGSGTPYIIKSSTSTFSEEANITMADNQEICLLYVNPQKLTFTITTSGLDPDDELNYTNDELGSNSLKMNYSQTEEFTSTFAFAHWSSDSQLNQGYIKLSSTYSELPQQVTVSGIIDNDSILFVEFIDPSKYYYDSDGISTGAIIGIAFSGFIFVVGAVAILICVSMKAKKRVSGDETENQLTNIKSTSTVYFFPIQHTGNSSSDNGNDNDTTNTEDQQKVHINSEKSTNQPLVDDDESS